MSQGQQVMADIKLIRAALAEQSLAKPMQSTYRLQKLPRQAVWIIHSSNGNSYRLTFQLAPLNTWAIHPPDSEASYLLGLIDRALNPQSVPSSVETPTVYHQQLHPWCVIQLLPQMQRRVVARFRRRHDAEAHMRVLGQQSLSMRYTVVFDPTPDQTVVAASLQSVSP